MGTTYTIKYSGNNSDKIQSAVDALLESINMGVSTYIPESCISIINNDKQSIAYDDTAKLLSYRIKRDSHFENNFLKSVEIYKSTEGHFDPTIMPLVNYWGFGYKAKKAVEDIDSQAVNNMVQLIGMDKWNFTVSDSLMSITKPEFAELDFSAIAKGYAVDAVAEYLDQQSILNYMVEIGGEVRCKGLNDKGTTWSIGLSKPEIDAELQNFQALLLLNNKAMASSGNYRNYYEVNGYLYGHEINPITGYPEINALLGTTVISESCAEADALATAFMIMGLEKTRTYLVNHPEIQAVLFYRNENKKIDYFVTDNVKNDLKILQ